MKIWLKINGLLCWSRLNRSVHAPIAWSFGVVLGLVSSVRINCVFTLFVSLSSFVSFPWLKHTRSCVICCQWDCCYVQHHQLCHLHTERNHKSTVFPNLILVMKLQTTWIPPGQLERLSVWKHPDICSVFGGGGVNEDARAETGTTWRYAKAGGLYTAWHGTVKSTWWSQSQGTGLSDSWGGGRNGAGFCHTALGSSVGGKVVCHLICLQCCKPVQAAYGRVRDKSRR